METRPIFPSTLVALVMIQEHDSYKCQIVDTVLQDHNTSVFQQRHKLDVKPFANIKSLCSPYLTFPIKDVVWQWQLWNKATRTV